MMLNVVNNMSLAALIPGSAGRYPQHRGTAAPLLRTFGTLVLLALCWSASATEAVFSTYLGGRDDDEPAGDMFIDARGYIYVTGPTKSADFPVTAGAFDTSFNDRSGKSDAFVMKLDPDGKVLWSTLLGTPTRDVFYTIKADAEGYVYLAGAFGAGAPTTPGALQRTFAGADPGGDPWDGYLAKLKPDGSGLVWATYLGTGIKESIRNMDIDPDGNFVVATRYQGGTWPSAWFDGSFQSEPQGGVDSVIIKVSADASRVVWASYIGGSADEAVGPNVAVDKAGRIHIFTSTHSADMPTTPGAHDLSYNGGEDIFVATLSADGRKLLMGTYLGTSDDEGGGGKRAIAVDGNGALVVGAWTGSSRFPVTANACRRVPMGFTPWGVTGVTARISPAGALLAATYIGNNEGLSLDSHGNVYVGLQVWSDVVPVTRDAFQRDFGGVSDGAVLVLSRDLDRVLYASYLGGSGDDAVRITAVGPDDSFYISGMTNSANLPILDPLQAVYGGSGDVFLAKFTRVGPETGRH